MAGRTLAASTWLTASLFCCCSTDWLRPLPSDEPDIERTARDYVRDHADTLVANPDGGTREGGGRDCVSGLDQAALDLGVAVVSRGHGGGGGAGAVTFNPVACALEIVVHVVLEAGVWVAVGAVVYDAVSGSELRRVGDPLWDFEATPDSDHGSGEFF